jgi:hypothetical protein
MGGMILLPVLLAVFQTYASPGRFTLRPYAFPPDVWRYPIAMVLGAWLAARAHGARIAAARYSEWRVVVACILGVVLGVAATAFVASKINWGTHMVWVLVAAIPLVPLCSAVACGMAFYKPVAKESSRLVQGLEAIVPLCAGVALVLPRAPIFPAKGTLAEREAWAEKYVPDYAAFVHVVEAIPEVTNDVGHVEAVAPTAEDEHVAAQTMDGTEIRVALDVVGEKGRGVLRADCVLDGTSVHRWDHSTWTFEGNTARIRVHTVWDW